MLILQTANGRIPIAKGNLYKITEENGQLIYITKDRIAIPVTKMNGVKVKTLTQALECVDKYADERGLEPREVEVHGDEILETLEDWGKRMDEEYKQYIDEYVKNHPNKDTSLMTDTVKDVYNGTQTILLTTIDGEEHKIKSDRHIFHEDKDGKLCYILTRPYKRLYVKTINGADVQTVKEAIEVLDRKLINKLNKFWRMLWKRF